MSFTKKVRLSNHPAAGLLRRAYYGYHRVSLPAPRVLVTPLRLVYTGVRGAMFFLRRVLIAEPIFKSYCTSYGENLHTGVFVHWINGRGRIVMGDDVMVDGKSSFKFAIRYADEPLLEVGSHTYLAHGCSFTVGKAIRIGAHCRIARNVTMFDAPGHALDPGARQLGDPSTDAEVKPIEIGDNVWIGANAIIFPGVTIGRNSVIAMGACVMTSVPADSMVGGNPARIMRTLVTVDKIGDAAQSPTRAAQTTVSAFPPVAVASPRGTEP